MRRRKLSKRGSRRLFTALAVKQSRRNRPVSMRGGIRL